MQDRPNDSDTKSRTSANSALDATWPPGFLQKPLAAKAVTLSHHFLPKPWV